ncbi:hypothetical protein [Flavobacterium ajazii]|nr:hypothetical protein [Flavobacterium ajazii]
MLEKFLEVEGVEVLAGKEQQSIVGGENVEDGRGRNGGKADA